uniref:Xylulose kinase-1 n=1 Tax=Tanacetum cinerariifolium TaxID=118510 RepID=A0A699GRK3_TANCI|nr:hypothetical protein [Tanacetum cinerariifolium]
MIAILEKYEHNVDFHQIVDFVEASHIRYALTINPTVYVSHIRKFWSTARIETTDEGTKILATVDGMLRTIFESSIRRNLKLNDEEGINTLPDAEFFENLTLMCLKSTGFNEFSSNIATAVTSALPHDSTPRVTSLVADEGSMQQQLYELTDLCTRLQRQHTEMATKIAAQDLKISHLKARIKFLEDKDGGGAEPSREDATIKGKSLEKIEKAANILTSRVQAVSVPPAAEVSTVGIPTGSGLVPTASPIFSTASVITTYSRHKGKEKMVESDTPKNKKLQEQIDVQMLIDGLDRNNEVIARHLHEYEQATAELTIREKIELINELVKYQYHHSKILKYQAQQSKPLSKKQQREFYMSVLKSHSGWKTKHFKGMSLEEIREKFILVWKQIEDFVPMAFKQERERMKRKGLRLEQESPKKIKTSEEVSQEDLKEMMQLVPVEELWTLVKETLSIRQATSDKEKELWVELKRLFETDFKDQLWIHTQALMYDPVEWRLYDTCGVHHVSTRDQEIFILVERDYPLRKGLAIVMITNKLQVDNYSQMASDLILKIHNITNSPRRRDD